ncbi:uncharacterized protein LOC129943258 [Eupeodes corollae]|uniref:uncharacterized protein LOC129943258 n=1 Tax=Eupeodes corollae TaxID=290404 RepID=UPI0024935E1A|nr:uncharacterized protein LOC129943258 [Eupeodes corollae]
MNGSSGHNTRSRGKFNNSRGQYSSTTNRNSSNTHNDNPQSNLNQRAHVVQHTPPPKNVPNPIGDLGQNVQNQIEDPEQNLFNRNVNLEQIVNPEQSPQIIDQSIQDPNQVRLGSDQVQINVANNEMSDPACCSNQAAAQNAIENANQKSTTSRSDNYDLQTLASAFERIMEANNKIVISEMKSIRDSLTHKLEQINIPPIQQAQTQNLDVPNSNPRVDFEQFLQNASFSTQNRAPVSHQTSTSQPSIINTNCKVEKWKISFDGTENVYDFWFKVETLKERSQSSWDHVLANFHVLLKGKAESWYWFFLKKNPTVSHDSLKYAIIKEFSKTENEYEKMLRMVSRRQGFKETFDDFYTEILRLNARLKEPLSDTKLIDLIKKNSKDNLGTLLFPYQLTCLEQMRDVARQGEAFLLHQSSQKSLNYKRNVSEIEQESDSSEDKKCESQDLEAFSKFNKPNFKALDTSNFTCWNCQKLGHSFYDCPSEKRNLFCYRCGEKNVTTITCSKHGLNGKASELTAGGTRSISTTPSQ